MPYTSCIAPSWVVQIELGEYNYSKFKVECIINFTYFTIIQIQIVLSPEFNSDCGEENCSQIVKHIHNISTTFAVFAKDSIRKLISLLLVSTNPFVPTCISTIISKFKHISATLSESGNYPLHEVLMVHSLHNSKLDLLNIAKLLIVQCPEALQHQNNQGKIPLHYLLMMYIHLPIDVELLQLLVQNHPESSR